MSLDFLKQIRIEDPAIVQKRSSGGGGRRKDWNPAAGYKIRVWKDGSVFPSAELVSLFSLEYGNKPAEGEKVTGNALDIFLSKDFPVFNTPVPLVLVNVVSKEAGKTDVFGSTTYNEDGTPKANVMEQGSNTFGKACLLPMLKEVYNIELGDDRPYVDLEFLGDPEADGFQSFQLPNGRAICHVPKQVARGDRKGEMTYARRENPKLYVLYPVAVQETGAELEQAPEQKESENVSEPVDAAVTQ